MLENKQYFPDVFLNFMQWVSNVTKKCSKKFDKSYYPGMVFHLMIFDKSFTVLDCLYIVEYIFANDYILPKFEG